MADSDWVEYDCVDCGRHIVATNVPGGSKPYCAACMMVPGWFNDPKVKAILDPFDEVKVDDRG